MFRGSYAATVDPKGRMKIPTAFKNLLDEKYGPDFFITSLSGEYVRIYPIQVWERLEARLAQLPSMNKAKKKFLERANRWGQMNRMDAQGRVLIPPQLRDSAAMHGEVTVLGYLEEYLEVWNKERFIEHLEEDPMTDEDEKALSDLNI
jgi:MraZ protein